MQGVWNTFYELVDTCTLYDKWIWISMCFYQTLLQYADDVIMLASNENELKTLFNVKTHLVWWQLYDC
jgi:hypothetical protein